MKRRKNWLQVAVRAYEAQTMNHRQHLAEARQALECAAAQHGRAGQAVQSLAEAWTALQREQLLAPEIDAAYRRFHVYLGQREIEAAQTRQDAQAVLDAAAQQLKTSHATRHMLHQVSERTARRHAQEASRADHRAMAETWLLGRLCKDEST